jgi:hypothetical protein
MEASLPNNQSSTFDFAASEPEFFASLQEEGENHTYSTT